MGKANLLAEKRKMLFEEAHSLAKYERSGGNHIRSRTLARPALKRPSKAPIPPQVIRAEP